jgi:hypothetical protein
MQPRASETGDPLIPVFLRIIVIVQPVLNLHQCNRAGENEMSHQKSVTAQ